MQDVEWRLWFIVLLRNLKLNDSLPGTRLDLATLFSFLVFFGVTTAFLNCDLVIRHVGTCTMPFIFCLIVNLVQFDSSILSLEAQ